MHDVIDPGGRPYLICQCEFSVLGLIERAEDYMQIKQTCVLSCRLV